MSDANSYAAVKNFLKDHFRHFNARELVAAAEAYGDLIDHGGKMLVSLAGAMSTSELGISLADMIRAGKVHAISCTAANLEEDVFNLVAHKEYRVVPNWRALSLDDEVKLRDEGFNRVTDTCIPETVMRHLEKRLTALWCDAANNGESYFPYEYLYRVLDQPDLAQHFQVPAKDSWVLAAKEHKIPIFSPGWEDSTLGNIFTARCVSGVIKTHACVRTGTEQMARLIDWYRTRSGEGPVGFFQIGGGIAGDFAICVVPLLIQDLREDVSLWSYFCQISDAVTSYGGYSGAVPNEKITWFKLDAEAPKFMIQSDASIVAPLIFAYVLAGKS